MGVVCAFAVGSVTACTDGSGGAAEDGAVSMLALVEELRIGALEGSGADVFGAIAGVAADADGTVFVLDRQVPVIRRFGPDGRYLGDVGRAGEGPGEYGQPIGLAALPAGGVAVWDPSNARLTAFATDGTVRGTRSVPSSLFTGRALATDTLGRFYVRAPAIPPGWRPEPGLITFPMQWIRLSPEGEVVDSIPIPPEGEDGPPLIVQAPEGTLRPYPVRTLSAPGPGGDVLLARSDTYLVTRVRPEGAAQELVRREYDRVPVAPAERAWWEGRLAEVADRLPPGSSTTIPALKPALQDLWTDHDGRIWVRLHVEGTPLEPADGGSAAPVDAPPDGGGTRDADPGEQPTGAELRERPTFDVYGADGSPVGRVRLPHRTSLAFARGDRIWVVERGAYGEAYVVRYALSPGG